MLNIVMSSYRERIYTELQIHCHYQMTEVSADNTPVWDQDWKKQITQVGLSCFFPA